MKKLTLFVFLLLAFLQFPVECLASDTEFRRHLLVLYGHDPKIEERPQISSPLDIATESVVQASAEWMGYELVYHCITSPIPSVADMQHYAGIVLDDSLTIPYAQEYHVAKWLIQNVNEGRRLLFLGGYPFEDTISQQLLFDSLAINQGPEWRQPVTETTVTIKDGAMMDFETQTGPLADDFQNVTAPEKALVHLRLQDISEAAQEVKRYFDAVYTCSWGGVILSPYVTFDSSEEVSLFHVNIPRFLANIWPSDHWPVPDVTTRNGLRIFYSHIDGDGFTSASSVSRDAICGEVMYETVLKDLPFPITVSIVEATIQGHLPHQKQKQVSRYHDVAKKIFDLPHVELASHSYSHPYVWDLNNLGHQEKRYKTLNLPLKLTARYAKIDMQREIKGSLDFIHNNLAPEGKKPEIMLWSGNCRPPPEVVAIADSVGVENMNGGDTIRCSRYPGLGNVSGKLIAQNGRIQVLASNQNEFLYTNGWRGPYHGGFSQVIETFEETETPVRLKPVNVYYHFYSVDRPAAKQALDDIYDWCRKQPLHSMTASQYAKIVKDSHNTRIVNTGERRWAITNKGFSRTLRVSNDIGYPDLNQSTGVIGFNRQKDWTYIHTSGQPKTELVMTDEAPNRPYIKTTDSTIEVSRFDDKRFSFQIGPRKTVVMIAQPTRKSKLVVNGKNESIAPNKDGEWELVLDPGTKIDVRY